MWGETGRVGALEARGEGGPRGRGREPPSCGGVAAANPLPPAALGLGLDVDARPVSFPPQRLLSLT